MKKVLVVLAALVLSMSMMIACGKGKVELKGKYSLVSVTDAKGENVEGDALKTLGMDKAYAEFLDDGKAKIDLGQAVDGTFQLNGKKVTITAGADKMEGTVEENKVVVDLPSGEKGTFQKQ
jgi:hypothetical protein